MTHIQAHSVGPWPLVIIAVSVMATACGAAGTKVSSSPSCAILPVSTSAENVKRGSTITVSGFALNSDCADTPNSPGNTNGRLLTDLEIVIAQDGHETVVAGVDARSGRYSEDIVIPKSLQPGAAHVWAQAGGGYRTSPKLLTLIASMDP